MTYCKTPLYAQETQTPLTCIDIEPQGFAKHLEVDTLIPQGLRGSLALDQVVRKCMGNEPGTTLHVGVPYTKLRLDIINEVVVSHVRVFLPGCMTLHVKPSTDASFVRVWVFRFIVVPTTCGIGDTEPGRVTKRKYRHTDPLTMANDDANVSDTVSDDE